MKTLVYWLGLILIGFSIWVSFIAVWIYLATNPPYYLSTGNLSVPAMLLAGAIIFIVIGWRMMKEANERMKYSKIGIWGILLVSFSIGFRIGLAFLLLSFSIVFRITRALVSFKW